MLKAAAIAAGISLPAAALLVKHLLDKRRANKLNTDLYKDQSADLMHEAEDVINQQEVDELTKELTHVELDDDLPARLARLRDMSTRGLRGGSIEAIAGKKLRPQAEKLWP